MERIKGKTLADFEGQEPSFSEKYEIFDPKKNANKFWHIYAFGQFIVRHHGRHGSKGLFTVHKTHSDWSARHEAREIAQKKYDKGYRDEANFLDRFAREIV
jgi:predicted DNA-binding WGR domain protein